MKKIITNSEKETIELAKEYTSSLKGGEVIGLIGELGAGKTIFTKGLAKGLGIKQVVNSPTFVLMKIYEVRSKKLEVRSLVHIDAYRVKTPADLTAIGAEEYFNRPDTVTVIEWADRIKKILPKKARMVRINNKGENKRIINF